MASPASRSRRRAASSGAARRRASTRRRARAARRRRWLIATAVTAVLAPALGLGIFALASLTPAPAPAAPLTPAEATCAAVGSYSDEQWAHAGVIVGVGQALGVSPRDQTIAVMTALGESSLRNLDYGDWETSGVTNPDGTRTTSIGLFQQQDSWGTREERLDPATAAALFYRAMLARVPEPDRSTLEPTLVAHRTQVNRDPQHYARYWERAQQIVAALAQGGCR